MKRIASRKILIFAVMLIIIVSALSSCVGETEATTLQGITVQQNDKDVTKIFIEEGSKIDYGAFQIKVAVSDGTEIAQTLSESVFLPTELAALYALSGGNTKTMTLYFTDGGRVVRGLLEVEVTKKEVVVQTYSVFYFVPDTQLTFEDEKNVTTLNSVPTTHPSLKSYQTIEWYMAADFNVNSKLVLPMALTENLTLFGKVRDQRTYTVKFWRDNEMTSQIGADIPAKYSDTIPLPSGAAVKREGMSFTGNWTYNGSQLSATGSGDNSWFKLYFDAPSYPATQIINIVGVYTLNEYSLTLYSETDGGKLDELTIDGVQSLTIEYGDKLRFGESFAVANHIVTVPKVPVKVGYTGIWNYRYLDASEKVVSQIYSESQGDKTLTTKCSLVAVYTKNSYAVSFYDYNGKLLSNITVLYGTTLTTEQIPAHSAIDADAYEYTWDNEEGLSAQITGTTVFREVRTPKEFTYRFIAADGKTELFSSSSSAYGSAIPIPTTGQIAEKLGTEYKSYFDYGWYVDFNSDPDSDTVKPITQATQPAATVTYYLKWKDTRTYTVNFYYQKLGENKISDGKLLFAVTVGFGKEVRYSGSQIAQVTGWEPKSIYGKTGDAAGDKIADGLQFIPSDKVTEYSAPVTIDVVVMYEKRIYQVTLNAPNWGGAGTVTFAVAEVPYGDMLETISGFADYDTADRADGSESYRFYGWVDNGGNLVDLSTTSVLGNMLLTAKWTDETEGSYGLSYKVYTDGSGNSYAYVSGYSGTSTTELIIGSRYTDNSGGAPKEYIVNKIGKIASDKNLTVTKIIIPSSVTVIETGAFADFFALTDITVKESAGGAFKTEDGVLYNAAQTELLAYPLKKVSAEGFTVPSSVVKIADSAFVGYNGANIALNDGLTEIGNNAFSNSALTSVTLPNGLKIIGDNAFYASGGLETVTYEGSSLTKIGLDAFSETKFIYSDTDADGLIMLGNYIIRAYLGVAQQFVLADSVLGIASGAFQMSADNPNTDTGILSVTIGSGSALQFIGDNAFDKCMSLGELTIGKTYTQQSDVIVFGKGVFDGISSGFAITIADETALSAYQTAYAGSEYDGLFIKA